MTIGLLIEETGRCLWGLGLLLAGFPVYAVWMRYRKGQVKT